MNYSFGWQVLETMVSAQKVHHAAPDLAACSGSWNPVAASGPQSALSGVLAGFVFAGMVVVLSTRPPAGKQRGTDWQLTRSYALQLLSAAFIIFALDSFLTSVTAGEQACNRAYAESILSGGVLGTGTIMLIAGICWLLVTYSDPSEGVRLVLKSIIIGTWLIVMLMLALSAMAEGKAMLTGQNQIFVDVGPFIIATLVAVCAWWLSKRPRRTDQKLTAFVLRATLASMIAALVSGVFIGIASGTSATWWYRPPLVAVYTIICLSMIIPLAALIASVSASLAAVDPAEDAFGGKTAWANLLSQLGLEKKPSVGDQVANRGT